MQGDSEDADAPGGVLDHGQDVSLATVKQFCYEEVARQDRLGLRTQELRPGWPGPPRGGVDAAGLEDLPHGGRCDPYPESGQLAVDPAVPPERKMLSSTFPRLCEAGDYVEPGG